MKNYDSMSDEEINQEVLAILHPEVNHMTLSADKKSFYDCGIDGNGFNEIKVIDYCNSPSDVMPIINIYKIRFSLINDSLWEAKDYYKKIKVTDKNPQRAACIVFILSKNKEEL